MLVLIVFTDHSISKFYHTIRHVLDCIIMCYHDHRISVFLVHCFDQFQNFLGSIVIKRTCRFITEQDIRILYDSTANCRSLLLASGQLVRKFSLMFKKTQCMQKFIYIQWRSLKYAPTSIFSRTVRFGIRLYI